MQPFLDRELTPRSTPRPRRISTSGYCRKRYSFEAELRVYVKIACREEMSPELKAKLVALRLPQA